MDYDYHRMPAPWLQVKLLQILAILGKDDATSSQLMYEVIGEALKRADIGLNAGSAVCVQEKENPSVLREEGDGHSVLCACNCSSYCSLLLSLLSF